MLCALMAELSRTGRRWRGRGPREAGKIERLRDKQLCALRPILPGDNYRFVQLSD